MLNSLSVFDIGLRERGLRGGVGAGRRRGEDHISVAGSEGCELSDRVESRHRHSSSAGQDGQDWQDFILSKGWSESLELTLVSDVDVLEDDSVVAAELADDGNDNWEREHESLSRRASSLLPPSRVW